MSELVGADEQQVRQAIGSAKRVLVKIGSSSLTSKRGLDEDRIARLVSVLSDAKDAGREVVLVTSGAIAAGIHPLGMKKRPKDLAKQQAAAAVGQGLLGQRYTELFAERGITIAQVLLTVEDITRQTTYRNALRAHGTLSRLGVIPVINENDTVATHEIRFGDNDRLAALVAELVRADAVILLTDVDGLYTAHPSEPGATKITFVGANAELEVDTHRLGSNVGSGGMTTKVQAAGIATSAGIPVLLAHADQMAEALAGEEVGTAFAPIDHTRPHRLLWLAHATEPLGSLTLDEGATRAILQRKASLLAAGITEFSGNFKAGDPVDLIDSKGRVIAKGFVSYDARCLPEMLGRNSAILGKELGDDFTRPVIHRDDLMVLKRR